MKKVQSFTYTLKKSGHASYAGRNIIMPELTEPVCIYGTGIITFYIKFYS
jgi:hypothetical protein